MHTISSGNIAENSSITSSPIFTPSTTSSETFESPAPERSTVIVGAGSIGLWIAYHHASAQAQLSTPNETIIVIDAEDSPFGATSATCTGCVHYGFKDQDLVTLGKYSFALWEQIAEAEEFRSAVGLRFDSIFGVNDVEGESRDLLPDWLRTSETWMTNPEFLGSRNAMVNPIGVGKWLTQACEDMGVQIWTSATVTAVELDEDSRATAVTGVRHDQSKFTLPCQTFILAGGPWTPSVFRDLFPSSPLDLTLSIEAGDWMLFRNPNPTTHDSIAFVGLDDIVGEKLEFAGRNDGTIWVCGRRNYTGSLMSLGTPGQPDPSMIAELTGRAYRFLEVHNLDNPVSFDELKVVGLGRAFRPVTSSGRPMISVVSPGQLSSRAAPPVNSTPSNVFLCWGHGSYGLTLGPGTGKLMSQLVRGMSPDIDLSPYGIPTVS